MHNEFEITAPLNVRGSGSSFRVMDQAGNRAGKQIPPFTSINLPSADTPLLPGAHRSNFDLNIPKTCKIMPMKRILFSVIIILFSVASKGQNTANLRMNLEKNRVYRFRSSSEQTITQTINGVQQTTESKVAYVMSMKMIDSNQDFMVAEVHFDTLINHTNTMGKAVSVSSVNEGDIRSSESADVLSCIMNRLSKNALYVKIDYTGKPVEVVNAAILPRLVLNDTANITIQGPAGQEVKKQLAETVSETNLKTMVEMFTHYLPGREVSKGEQWTITNQLTSGGMMLDIVTTYRLDRLDGDKAWISSESAIKASDNAAPIESGGATVTYGDLKGISRADMVIDAFTGLRIEETGKTSISGTLGISAAGFSMQMPMEIKGENKVIVLQ